MMEVDDDLKSEPPAAADNSASMDVDGQDVEQPIDTPLDTPSQDDREGSSKPRSPSARPTIWIQEPGQDQGDEDKNVLNDSYSKQTDVNPSYTMTVVHSRRNANGTIGSVYSGNKIRHLKKEDGVPLWRKDIQYSFLRAVFEDSTPVFTLDIDGSKGHTFADIYIHAMARSSKTSKVLREKLLSDRESAMNMAMICLLVNVGRMNTTLNFFPEMRAQLRTYHSIPCLQVHQDANSQYKGLQDAPRLKSILKGSCEDSEQPNSVEKIQASPVPRTNPVNLIFVLSQYAPKISEAHFFQPRDFFDLVIRSTLSSRSRAKAFLWLIWWYLESDFSREAALNNPFGPGLPSDDDPDGMPIKVPAFEHLTEEQANAENPDTEEEKVYGEKMGLVRKRILEEDETVGPPLKKTAGPSPARSDVDRTRSPSPTNYPPLNLPKPRKVAAGSREGNETPRSDMEKQQTTTRLVIKPSKVNRAVESSPVPPGAGHAVLNSTAHAARRARPETSHQRALNNNRRMRVDQVLYKRRAQAQKEVLKHKRTQTTTRTYLAMNRIFALPDDYDTEDEKNSWGPGGLVPNPGEEEDYGGEAVRYKKIIDRTLRRLDREESGAALGLLTHGLKPRKRKLEAWPQEEEPKEKGSRARTKGARARELRPAVEQGDALDDLDLDLLGEGDESDDPMNGLDDSDDGGDATVGEEEEAPKKNTQTKEKGLLKRNGSRRGTPVSKDKSTKKDGAGSKRNTPGHPGVEDETFTGNLRERLSAQRPGMKRSMVDDDTPKKERKEKKPRRSKKGRADKAVSDEEEFYSDGISKTLKVGSKVYPGKVFDPNIRGDALGKLVWVDDDGVVWDRSVERRGWHFHR